MICLTVSFNNACVLYNCLLAEITLFYSDTRKSVSLAVDVVELSTVMSSSLECSGYFRASLGAKSRSVKTR